MCQLPHAAISRSLCLGSTATLRSVSAAQLWLHRLTHPGQETLMGTVPRTEMSTHRARLRSIVGVYLDRHRTVQESFIGNHAMQFGKRPLGLSSVGFPLFLAHLFALSTFRSLSNVFQLLQADQAVRVSDHDAFGDHMIRVLLQPSLPSTNDHQSPGSRTGAFLLQALSQSRSMISFMN